MTTPKPINSYNPQILQIDKDTIAKNGFTASKFTFHDEGMTTSANATLVTGFTAPHNSRTQTLTLSSLTVHPNSGKPVKITIRPTDVSLFRHVDQYVTVPPGTTGTPVEIEALSDDSTRREYIFTSTRLGSRDLELGGDVNAYVSDGSYHTSVNSTVPQATLADGSVIWGSQATNTNLGSWPVRVELQALNTSYEAFTIKASSSIDLSDVELNEIFINLSTGDFLKLSERSEIFDVSNKSFLADFQVDPTMYSIVKSFITSKVVFKAGSEIPEGTKVFIDNYVASTVAGSVDLSLANAAIYSYGNYPKYTIELHQGTIIENTFQVLDGYELPGGQLIPVGSNTSDKPLSSGKNLVLKNIKVDEDFYLPFVSSSSTKIALEGIVPTGKYIIHDSGLTSKIFQPVSKGMKTDSDLHLNKISFSSGMSLETEMTFKNYHDVSSSIEIAPGSVLKKGTLIYRGSASIGGAIINGNATFDKNARVTNRLEISSSFIVDQSNSSSSDNGLSPGTTLKGPFTFGVGTKFTSGNTLPTSLKILPSMGATLKKDMEIPVGSVFGTNATLRNDIGFSPTSVIPALSTLTGVFSFPVGTKFSAGFNSSSTLSVPSKTYFPAGSVIKAGTSFRDGSLLPAIYDIRQHTVDWGTGGETGPVSTLNDPNNKNYVVFKARTTFMPGFQFPVGTILAKNTAPGTTVDYGILTNGDVSTIPDGSSSQPLTYDLAAASFSLDENQKAPSQDIFTFTCGTPTDKLVVMLSDTNLPYDVAIPLDELDPEFYSQVSFNEEFKLKADLLLISNYTVNGSNNMIWPANVPIPFDFVLSSPQTLVFTTGTQISKSIHLNVNTTSEFVHKIMSSTSTLKFPPAGYTLTKPLKLGIDESVPNNIKAFVQLPAGTKLDIGTTTSGTVTTPNSVTLAVPMHVPGNFTITTKIDTYPRFSVQNGIILPPNSNFPGTIIINSGQPLPESMTLPDDVILASDVVLKRDHTMNENSRIAAGSVLARGTKFVDGVSIDDGVVLGPIHSLSDDNRFMLAAGEELTSNIMVPYLLTGGSVDMLHLDNRALIKKVADLMSQISVLEASLGANTATPSRISPAPKV